MRHSEYNMISMVTTELLVAALFIAIGFNLVEAREG
jgi:hypothetical protein